MQPLEEREQPQSRAGRERSLIHNLRSVDNTAERVGDLDSRWGEKREGIKEPVIREMARVDDLANIAGLKQGDPFEVLARRNVLNPGTSSIDVAEVWMHPGNGATIRGILDGKLMLNDPSLEDGKRVSSIPLNDILLFRNLRERRIPAGVRISGLPLAQLVQRAGLENGDSFEIRRDTEHGWVRTHGVVFDGFSNNPAEFKVRDSFGSQQIPRPVREQERIIDIQKSPPADFYSNKG